MKPISVNELTESINSNLPRDIKSTIAKNILTKEKDPESFFCRFVHVLVRDQTQNHF